MHYYKEIIQNYIISVGTGLNEAEIIGEEYNIIVLEITEEEYNTLLNIIHNRPIPPEGFDYILKADTLTWELIELPEPEPTIEDEAEAYNILIGGTP